MPFKSEKQKRYLYANQPEIAERWSKKYGNKIQASASKSRKKRGKSSAR